MAALKAGAGASGVVTPGSVGDGSLAGRGAAVSGSGSASTAWRMAATDGNRSAGSRDSPRRSACLIFNSLKSSRTKNGGKFFSSDRLCILITHGWLIS